MSTEMEQAKMRLFASLRLEMARDGVLDAMERVPRNLFVPERSRHLSYEDIALPIEDGQTISQPYIVALMTQALDLKKGEIVLELGTGSGYQAAILSLLARKVYSMERISSLAERAKALLTSLDYANVEVRLAGSVLGCPEEAPFDAIIVTAASPRLPRVLLEQMAQGGRLIIPVGSHQEQDLMKVVKADDGYSISSLGSCRFVPLLGNGAWDES
ncbi:protein-L-isoaspartate(D-aspartate) O-methyltransferase [SAR202 cluster bacterium AC-647-N09_OGT_505m]|nr:protein-L-isoaspartate(D-aspartate) O-methyltransferase [SAR202 cluster bacterium AC-647-N09_OGT_505m]